MKKDAVISSDEKYRYALWRTWDSNLPRLMFVCLNPSTADAAKDDPTLRRCIGFAREWGFGSVCIGNLFAYRTPNPSDLKGTTNPVGNKNDLWLSKLFSESDTVIAAWGNNGSYLSRDKEVMSSLKELYCLSKTKSNAPKHPLYVRASQKYSIYK
ncbi:MAG: hypothetical protein COA54_10425 [Thiotrichaceae bacterium]|nr:MAG: hypothetical protein COA54_10425 [Thiotrichaceae bacterium]